MRPWEAPYFGPLLSGNLLFAFILLAAASATLARAQIRILAQVPSSTAGKRPIVFGTDADLQDSGKEKGADIGVVDSEPDQSGKSKKRGEFAVAPIPMVNPSIGNGGGAAVADARKFGNNPRTPASTFGAAGFYTENGSWMLGAGVRLYLANDRYRITGAVGGGEFNYKFFGVGSDAGQAGASIPLAQSSRAFLIEPKIRILPHTYIGPRYHHIANRTSLNEGKDPGTLPIPLPEDLRFDTAALGLRALRDTSDNPFYPTVGSLIDLTADFFGPAVGGDRTYQNGTLSFNKYFLVAKRNVFALRTTGCVSSSSTPFFDVCQLGWPKDLRGYQIGQYRDLRMMVGQAEYRRGVPLALKQPPSPVPAPWAEPSAKWAVPNPAAASVSASCSPKKTTSTCASTTHGATTATPSTSASAKPSDRYPTHDRSTTNLPCPILSPFFWRQGGRPRTQPHPIRRSKSTL